MMKLNKDHVNLAAGWALTAQVSSRESPGGAETLSPGVFTKRGLDFTSFFPSSFFSTPGKTKR